MEKKTKAKISSNPLDLIGYIRYNIFVNDNDYHLQSLIENRNLIYSLPVYINREFY